VLQLLIGGTDAHARNYSIQHLDGGSRLAPLYDVATVLPYLPSGRSPRLAMAIGGETASSEITSNHLKTEARACRLPREWLVRRIGELVNGLSAATEAALGDTIALPTEASVIQRAAEALLEHGRATAERVEAI
jgi:serine/threonine-protein kinase HipA